MAAAVETAAARQVTDVGEQLAGKYLTFLLSAEEYGIEILKVQEIIQMQKVTRVPKAPNFIRGVINLRGKVIPVVELRKKFDMEQQDDTEKTCIIVVMIESAGQPVTMGIIIDEVKEVLDIEAVNIEETPSFGASINTEFIMGIGKVGDNVKMLLDIDKVLSTGEIEILQHASQAQA
ncbi:MAG: chemotaxis protein CheW [Chitinivibrionales bacterium]|nr:chemotaxis protein CheW [Chitinivibrionales bacterium]